MRVVGIDPGSVRFGLAVLEKKGSQLSVVYSTAVKLSGKSHMERFKQIIEFLESIYRDHLNVNEKAVAIEEGYVGVNAKSADLLAKIRGLCIGFFLQKGLDVQSYSPKEIKRGITGSGNADKSQIARFIGKLMKLDTANKSEDETDALAVAVCRSLQSNRRIHI